MLRTKYAPNTERNLEGVEFEKARKAVDSQINALHDQLSDCYYGYWRQGKSKPFVVGARSWDMQATPAESKDLFDKLHGLIFMHHEKKLFEFNDAQPAREQDARLKGLADNEQVSEKTGAVIAPRRTTVENGIAALAAEGIEFDI